ncbi:uncharacterized protein JCM15063_003358 [Sporobolomyces koalae]|uniref:uncharacterized protein n=1 Tax=Sporobolomyces koalae TaxID=500713 RepID=UPI00316DDA2E
MTGSGTRPPPPSFSSFPEPEAAPSKPAPPAFSSFPTRSPPRHERSPPPRKRPRASEFLDQLGAEIGLEPVRERSAKSSGSKSSSSRQHRDRKSSTRESEHKSRSDSSRRARDEKNQEAHRTKRDRSSRETDESKDRDRHRRHKDSSKSQSREAARPSKSALTLEPSSHLGPAIVQERKEKPLFYESRKGDDLNIAYGGLHRGDVPRYRRDGAGRVLGLNEGLRITRETAYTGRGVEIAPLNRYKTPRYVDPSSARHLNDKNAKRIALLPRRPAQPQILGESPEPGPAPPALVDDSSDAPFIAFGSERSHADKLATLEHEEGTEYRSIAGLVDTADLGSDSEEDNDLDEFGTLGISGGESQDEYLKRRNIELDRALRDDPKNIKGWLDFVDFQDEVAQRSFVGSSLSYKRALSHNERTSTAEIKLAILTRALAIEGNEDAEPLLLAYLRAAAQVEDPKKVLQRWRDVLREHPDLTGLWIEYVSWRQTSWVNFSVKDVVEVFEECLDVLMLAMLREDIGSNELEAVEGNAIYLFLRLCLMLRQAGYSERAFAAFQAIVELNLFRPSSLSLSSPDAPRRKWTDKVVDELEEFWDSEVPRIGESTARGWSHSIEEDFPSDAPASEPSSGSPLSEPDARAFEKWAHSERTAALTFSRPARATDPEDSEDPFRIVLFDDLRSFMFVVHAPDSKLQLAYAFFTFLGLPFVPPDFPTSTPFTVDSFIHSELVERPSLVKRFWPQNQAALSHFDTIHGEAMDPERRNALGTPFETPFSASPAVIDQMLLPKGKGRWFATLRPEDLEDIDVEAARNALGLLRTVLQDPFITLALFAFESVQSPKGAVKTAKLVLRDERNNLALWDGYARIERQRGKIQDARQVYSTALSMSSSFKPEERIDAPLLWRSWAEMEWEEGNAESSTRILVSATTNDKPDLASLVTPRGAPVSTTELLRARQYYSTQLEAAFQPRATQSILRNRNHFAYSAALLAYTTQGLDQAIEILECQLFRLECINASGTAEHEEVYMLYAKLLYRHSTRAAYRPGQLRDLLERAIEVYKNNTVFLSLFYHNELRMKIQNRIRTTLESKVLRDKDVASQGYLFAVFAELHLDVRSQNVWAVRNLFDRAVENPQTKSSPSIWTLYIDFEVRIGELSRAKALIYRALQECPWCKEFYLRPFSPTLRSVYRSTELRDFHHLLLEKGLRIRTDLDPFLDGAPMSDDEMAEDDGDAGDQGIGEEVFTERKKLMPY